MPRFVILRHQPGPNTKRPPHWDLMFEHGNVLRTFACTDEPIAGDSKVGDPDVRTQIEAEQIDDHRLIYLDYEGPISGGRGDVRRWDHGTFDVIEDTPGCWQLELRGMRWIGTVTLREVEPQRWIVTLPASSTD